MIRRIVLLTVAAFTAVSLGIEARQTPAPLYERTVVTSGAGPQRLAPDAAMLAAGVPFRVVRRGSREYADDGLVDLRLVTDGGRPVPYLLMQQPPPDREWVTGRVLPIAVTKKTSGFEADLGATRALDMFRADGIPAPYLKRVMLEGSGDRQHWTTLVREGTLFDLPDERLRQDALRFTSGPYRYLRVTWDDTNSAPVRSPSLVEARTVAAVPPPRVAAVSAVTERRPSEPGVSRYRIRLPGPRLPIVALELEVGDGVSGGHVFREARVSESRFAGLEAAPVELGRAMLSRVVRDGVTAAALRVPITQPSEADLELTIDDGANEPLDLRGVSAVLADLPWIYFEAPAGKVLARYGDPRLKKPAYDLEAVRGSVDLAKVPEARFEGAATTIAPAEGGEPAIAAPAPGPALEAATFRFARSVAAAADGGNRTGLVALQVDGHLLANSRGPSGRFADVRLLDDASRQLPYLVERRSEPLSLDLTLQKAPDATASRLELSADGRQRTVYTLVLPYAGLPSSLLVLDTSARVFQRGVRVGVERPPNRDRRTATFEVRAESTWRHADDRTAAVPLAVRLEPSRDTELLVVIDEGDNAPLAITAARLLLPSYRLRFFYPEKAGVQVVYGRDDLDAPRYDLALLAPRVMGASATDVVAAPAGGQPPSTAAKDAGVSKVFWVVLTLAVLVLLGLIVKLLRTSS